LNWRRPAPKSLQTFRDLPGRVGDAEQRVRGEQVAGLDDARRQRAARRAGPGEVLRATGKSLLALGKRDGLPVVIKALCTSEELWQEKLAREIRLCQAFAESPPHSLLTTILRYAQLVSAGHGSEQERLALVEAHRADVTAKPASSSGARAQRFWRDRRQFRIVPISNETVRDNLAELFGLSYTY
jgi:hypothetical protein